MCFVNMGAITFVELLQALIIHCQFCALWMTLEQHKRSTGKGCCTCNNAHKSWVFYNIACISMPFHESGAQNSPFYNVENVPK